MSFEKQWAGVWSVTQIMLSSKAEGPVGALSGSPKCWAGMCGLSPEMVGPSDTTRPERLQAEDAGQCRVGERRESLGQMGAG